MTRETNHDDGRAEDPQGRAATASLVPVRMSGDERERAVLLEANVRGNRVLIDALLGVAVVTALLGNWLVPAAILAILILSGRLVEDYARERQVDVARLSKTPRPDAGRLRPVLAFVAITTTFAAMAYTGVTGTGLVPSPDVVGTGPDASPILRTAAWSLPMWAAVGMVVLVISSAVKHRRRSQPDDGR